ncbi:PaaX family transcriptional regulator [Shimia litoralis]|uniref:PaaX family transcriptional regulator n=1 Tax=Shimia litoralis TaxID=420403 RepID=A0A4U7N8E0_9RHOB|nr:PaaX family transcriptional regulator C-terminal domain-containing protein [Shimia litoralis]TKZ22038.1 PaaX family transcriptional regulator [Shimia litoralis]
MAQELSQWFQDTIATLTYNRNQRVWSIIVTIFGDLARNPQDKISGAVLSRVTEPMGIRPEALRVALHRLRNDGWLISEKSGRSSLYQLSEFGRAQSNAASKRIYAQFVPEPDTWHVIVLAPANSTTRTKLEASYTENGYLLVTSGVLLGDGPAPCDLGDVFALTGSTPTVPDWLRNRIGSADMARSYADLEIALDQIDGSLGHPADATPTQLAALRTVIVHNWRKALFAHPDLPDSFFPDGWRGLACRRKVAKILDSLERPSLQDLHKDLPTK